MPHRTMDDQARAAYEEQSVQLRAELKKWEGDWASANGGKKPGRADIKQNPDIARKYKQYNKLRDILAGKVPPPPLPAEATHGPPQRKRSQSEAALPPQTPSKRPKPAQTPQKARHVHPEAMPPGAQTPSATRPAMTPSLDKTTLTPVAAVPTSISPTPQKDGRVLGIFDLLGRTPSKPTATPSKPRTLDALGSVTVTTTTTTPTTARFASTPKSTRTTTQLLFQTSSTTPSHKGTSTTVTVTTPFKTPSTNRISNTKPTASTPTSSTPSFLRRRTTVPTTKGGVTLSSVDEQDENGDGVEGEDEEWKSIGPLRLPRKLGVPGRGLSSVVAGLRRMEEEAFGEEEEALREVEMMERGGHSKTEEAEAGEEGGKAGMGEGGVEGGLGRDLLGSDNPGGEGGQDDRQPGGLLSGFDNEALHDSLEDEEKRDSQQQPLRQFKKRGQKRTTRLVNMRPTRAKRPAQTEVEPDEDEDEVDMVPETQHKPTAAADNGDGDLRLSDPDPGSGSDFDAASESDEDEKTAKGKTKEKKATAAAGKDGEGTQDKKGEGVVKKAVRKVKATAHANFKRLKLRNSGAKGGPGFNSRFRRRR